MNATFPPRPERPEIAANFALTWDGRVSTRNRTPSNFSSPADKQRMLEIRAGADAVLIGRVTLETEGTLLGLPDAALQARRVERGQSPCPIRVLVSNSGRFDPALPIFASDFSPIVIFSTGRMPAATAAALTGKARLYLADAETVDVAAMLETLRREWVVRRLLCEGGPTLCRSLLEGDLVDEINVTFCPWVFGGAAAPTLTGCAGAFLPQTREFRMDSFETVGGECFVRYRRQEWGRIDNC